MGDTKLFESTISQPLFYKEIFDETNQSNNNKIRAKPQGNLKQYICDICDKEFHLKIGLEMHRKTHQCSPTALQTSKNSEAAKYSVTERSTISQRLSKLAQNHEKVNQIFQHACYMCDATFSSVFSLDQHVGKHISYSQRDRQSASAANIIVTTNYQHNEAKSTLTSTGKL